MSRWLPISLLLLLAASVGGTGCADPNPTFVFDAAPAVKEGGTDTSASATDAGQDADDGGDANTDATGGSQ